MPAFGHARAERATLNRCPVLNQVTPFTVLSNAGFTPRPSACPGLLRIVVARDGGICRIKLPGGELSAAQARAIAHASARHAGSVIELTNRANLQVRGVKRGEETALIAALVEAGLGPTPANAVHDPLAANATAPTAQSEADEAAPKALSTSAADEAAQKASSTSAADEAAQKASGTSAADEAALNASSISAASAADDVRNVMISPVAGRDPFALVDTRPLCADLLTMLQSETRFAALSPKFALLLDGGERLARVDHPHDVWLAASRDEDSVRFVFGLAGCPPADTGASPTQSERFLAHDEPSPQGTGALAAILPSQVCALVRALLHTFLDLADADATRMRHLLARHSAEALLHHAQPYVDFPLARDASLAGWRRGTQADAGRRLGAHAQSAPGTCHVGAQPALGRLDADTLHGLAALAEQHGNGTLRVTPWQSVLLPDVATHAADAALNGLTTLGLACDPAQAITRLIACAGSSGCAKSLADTKADALGLAARLPAGVDVHLSGCLRSCAAAHCAPYTLLAAAPGLYDLYRRDGRPGFGQCVARQLTIGAAADLLERLARSSHNA